MSARPRRVAGVTSRELADGELAILDATGEQLLIVSPVAGAVWALCDGEHRASEIADVISEQFPEASADQILRDVEMFLQELTHRGCLEQP